LRCFGGEEGEHVMEEKRELVQLYEAFSMEEIEERLDLCICLCGCMCEE
jgi:hypothetical protein